MCPIRTPSAKASCLNKCSLSSREVKSTGVRFRVVTLASAVMAKIATTNGRWCLLFVMKKRSTFNAERSIQISKRWTLSVERLKNLISSSSSFRFADLVFKSHHFLFHLAQRHARDRPTWFVKQVNDRAGKAANQNDEEAQ